MACGALARDSDLGNLFGHILMTNVDQRGQDKQIKDLQSVVACLARAGRKKLGETPMG